MQEVLACAVMAEIRFYDSGLQAINQEGGHGIAIIKPRENHKVLEMAKGQNP